MACSGVWENVILPKTPTFEGVSGIIIQYIIDFVIYCQGSNQQHRTKTKIRP